MFLVYYCEECNLCAAYYYIGRSVLLVPAALLTPSVSPSVPFAAGFQATKALGVLLVPSLSGQRAANLCSCSGLALYNPSYFWLNNQGTYCYHCV